jgi:hypothetical protein
MGDSETGVRGERRSTLAKPSRIHRAKSNEYRTRAMKRRHSPAP